jgi:ABC-type branched-subunit amino acid transport system ATPase component
MYSLELRSVHAHWHSYQTVLGYDGGRSVSIKIPRGRWVALLGENGIGKSTLLHAIGGTANFVTGQVLVNGVSLPKREPAARFGAGVSTVLQRESFEGDLAFSDCVDLVMCKRPGLFNESAIKDLLRRLKNAGLIQDNLISPRIFDLVCALLSIPQVLLLDEIMPAWPQKSRNGGEYSLLRELLPGTTVLFTDHDVGRALVATDQVLWLIQDDTPRYFSVNDRSQCDQLQYMLGGEAVVDGQKPLSDECWQMIKLDRSALSQVRLALQARGIRGKARSALESSLFKDFAFLMNDMPAEVLSGGQRTVLLWILLEASGMGVLPRNLLGHLDKQNRSRIESWAEKLRPKTDAGSGR